MCALLGVIVLRVVGRSQPSRLLPSLNPTQLYHSALCAFWARLPLSILEGKDFIISASLLLNPFSFHKV